MAGVMDCEQWAGVGGRGRNGQAGAVVGDQVDIYECVRVRLGVLSMLEFSIDMLALVV